MEREAHVHRTIRQDRMTLHRLSFWLGLSVCVSFAAGQAVTEKDFAKQISDAAALYRQGKLDEATSLFEMLHKVNGRSSEVDAWLGFLYLRANKAPLAIPLLEAADKQRPLDLEVQINLGNAFLMNGDLDKALDRYRIAAKLSPSMFEPHYNSGTIYLRQRSFTKAVTEFSIASRLKPNDAYVQNNLGVAYDNLKFLPQAADAFKRASDLIPTNVTFAHNAGLALSKLRRPEALHYLEEALGDGTDPAIALALGDAYSRAGRKADALKYYEGLRVAEARNPVFWFNLGVMRAQNQDLEGAEQAYRRVLELNPTDLDSLNNLALLLYRKKQYEEAATLFEKLSGLNPSSIATKLNLAAAASKSGDMRKAIDAWKDIIRLEPKRVPVRLDLANGLWGLGDVEGARYHYLQILSIEKDNAEALNGVGLCYLQTSKLPQAEAAFRSSLEANPKLIGAYNNLAVTLQRMNHVADAIKVLEKALTIAPDDEEIKTNLRRMRGDD
jgi:tetratricopeptide (TPR) repeat protein